MYALQFVRYRYKVIYQNKLSVFKVPQTMFEWFFYSPKPWQTSFSTLRKRELNWNPDMYQATFFISAALTSMPLWQCNSCCLTVNRMHRIRDVYRDGLGLGLGPGSPLTLMKNIIRALLEKFIGPSSQSSIMHSQRPTSCSWETTL